MISTRVLSSASNGLAARAAQSSAWVRNTAETDSPNVDFTERQISAASSARSVAGEVSTMLPLWM